MHSRVCNCALPALNPGQDVCAGCNTRSEIGTTWIGDPPTMLPYRPLTPGISIPAPSTGIPMPLPQFEPLKRYTPITEDDVRRIVEDLLKDRETESEDHDCCCVTEEEVRANKPPVILDIDWVGLSKHMPGATTLEMVDMAEHLLVNAFQYAVDCLLHEGQEDER